ncbi:uncharacterized protein LOC143340223 [Colletes latitarsis]|uniref:uncharacterized protein LOC143340223 n=1 Tax=Colletes latitarsis TaxID=2605962 RepID=UPI00403674FF
MSRQYCFLCASDEGVFLDITDANKKLFHEQFTICSLVTVPKVDQLPTKICHKCAYELNQCSSFVSKYKRCITVNKKKIRKNCCGLCFESVKKEYVFNLSEDTLKHNLLHKIQRLFNNEFEKFEEACELICLSCRYTVDVLFDLKNLSQEIAYNLKDIINNEIDYSNFPKINTAVISRKTTITDSARTALYTLQDSDTELSKMTRTRSQKGKLNDTNSSDKLKLQICEKCQSTFRTNNDVHKSKKSGPPVCKSCWAETGSDTNEINKQQSLTETKFCKVFLKDVLKDKTVSNQKLYKVKEDGQGKKKYIVTDVLPEENSKTQGEKSPKIVSDIESNTARQGQKRSLRSMRTENTDSKEIATKKLKSNIKQKNTDSKSTSLTESLLKRPNLRGQKIDKRNPNQRPDSDSTLTNNVNVDKRKLTRHKRATDASLSDADVDNKPDRKKLKSILAGNIVITNLDASSSVYDRLRKKNIRFENAAPIMVDVTNQDVTQESSRRKELALKSKPSSIKRTSEKSDDSKSDNEKTEDDKNETYTCEECGANYETKLTWLSHKLTHYKQPKLELQKVNASDTTKDTLNTKEAVEDLCEDQSETIAIRVDDDEEEAVTDATNLDVNVTTDKTQSSMKELNEIVDVESISDDHDSDHDQQTKNKVEKPQSQEDAETTVTKSTPEKVKRNSRKDRSRKRLHSPRSRRSRKISDQSTDKNADKSETENNTSTEEDMNTSLREDENSRTKGNQDISLTPIKNGQAKENENILLVQNEKNLDTKQNKDEEENVESTTEERLAVLESKQKETEKDNDDVDGEKETIHTQDESEIIDKETNDKGSETNDQENVAKDKESETNDKESETNDKKSEAIDKESETNDKESETNDKESETNNRENETNDKESEINDKENETNDKESETNDKESEINEKESETNDKESETNDKESETIEEESESIVKESEATDKESLNGVKSSKDCSDESTVKDVAGSSKTVKRKSIEVEDSSDEDIRIVNVNSSKNTAKEKSTDPTENVDFSSEDEIECTQVENDKPLVTKEVIVISETNSSVCNDDVEEVEITEQRKSAKDSADAAAEVLQEVLDLASAEVEKRNESVDVNIENDSNDMETLENISREIRNGENASPLKLNSSQTTVISL